MDLHLIEFDQHDVRVDLAGVVPLHLGVIRGSRRGTRSAPGWPPPPPRRSASSEPPGSASCPAWEGVGTNSRRASGSRAETASARAWAAVWSCCPSSWTISRSGRLGQHPGFTGTGVDPGHGLLAPNRGAGRHRPPTAGRRSRRPGVGSARRGPRGPRWCRRRGARPVGAGPGPCRRAVLKVNGVVPRQMIPGLCLPCRRAKMSSASACSMACWKRRRLSICPPRSRPASRRLGRSASCTGMGSSRQSWA